jgi:hypothetical protein
LRFVYLLPLLLFIFCLTANGSRGQAVLPGAPVNLNNAPQKDTTNRMAQAGWHDDRVTITARRANNPLPVYADTSIHIFHRRPFSLPWYRDLGNLGSPSRSLFFMPGSDGRTGPSLGYHAFDVYQMDADSVLYYNTTRPYSFFNYQLGSKLEQSLWVMHTQNITPSWNFAVNYNKINSPGYYKVQRTNQDHGSFSTIYQGPKQHYNLKAAFVYNLAQQDENGGISADSFLTQDRYDDRRTVPVDFDNPSYSTRRSAVTNRLRDVNILLQHDYTWGRRDTLYNADSTQYHFELTPRFRVAHRLEIGAQKYTFKDVRPDSVTWSSFFRRSFATSDSVFSQQQWTWADNRFLLNGFLGKRAAQLLFNAGIGNRVDAFRTYFISGDDRSSIISNYLIGEVRKDALQPGQWSYNAAAQFFFSGEAAGNFVLHAEVGKDLGHSWGALTVGFKQSLNEAPYSYARLQNQYYLETNSLNKESITQLYATVASERLGLSGGVRNYVLGNYIYLADSLNRVSNGRLQVRQSSSAFNLTQVWARKAFYLGHFVLDNELAFQQIAGGAPIEVPALLGRHQLSYEGYLFGKVLKIATGAEFRYHTAHKPLGYAPFYNRFYYQDAYNTGIDMAASLFFNFKVKRFRAYLMGDQLQRLWMANNVPVPGYPSQDVMIRFGFDWVLVN